MSPAALGVGATQMSPSGELVTAVAARYPTLGIGDKQVQERSAATRAATSTTSTARCGPACQVVWEGSGPLGPAPIPIQTLLG
jgi:hypothetical protein